MKKLFSVVAGALVAASGTVASADTVAVSGHAFTGAYNTDTAWINRNIGRAFNHDSASGHYAAAAIPIDVFHYVPVAKFYVSGNGQNMWCMLITRNLNTGSVTSTSASTSVSGNTTLSMSLSFAHGPFYAHSGFCYLPAYNGNFASIYGVALTAQ